MFSSVKALMRVTVRQMARTIPQIMIVQDTNWGNDWSKLIQNVNLTDIFENFLGGVYYRGGVYYSKYGIWTKTKYIYTLAHNHRVWRKNSIFGRNIFTKMVHIIIIDQNVNINDQRRKFTNRYLKIWQAKFNHKWNIIKIVLKRENLYMYINDVGKYRVSQ